MVDLLVSPLSFAPTKVGYKQYLKAGGSMQLASFQVFERRTAIEVLSEKADKMWNSAMYHIAQYEAYAKIEDRVNTKVHLESYDIRINQYIDVCTELRKLGVIHE
jgi:hypothetical protein